MNIQKLLAIITGKIILKVISILNIGGGSAAPGLYALKIDPDLVAELVSEIPQTIVITGTNGKTTTARMLSHFVQNDGLKVIRNATGSNLERGIASTLISSSHIPSGKLSSVDLAIWELDEAAFNNLIPKLKPNIIVFLNVFRDQLDRYGEIDNVVKKWIETLKKIDKKTVVFINGDDQNLSELKKAFPGKVQIFGLKDYQIEGEAVFHKAEKEKFDFEAKKIKSLGLEGSKFELLADGGRWEIFLPIPGIYHIYDFLGAFACASELELQPVSIIESFKNFSPAFGRVEKFSFTPSRWEAKHDGYIFLIKNPAGATQVFQTLKNEIKKNDRLLIALNDNLADGTDVSWIWDVNFDILQNSSRAKSRDYNIICSGTRAEDLAIRLKYAGVEAKNIKVENNLKKALKEARKGLEGRLFILPTYTALLQIQRILAQSGLKRNYWEEK